MSYVADELRRLNRENARLNRKVATGDVEGEVVERDEKNWKVRLKLGEDPETGKAVLGPWVRPNSGNNQPGFKVSAPLPAIGTRMRLKSPSGIVGAASYADPAPFDGEQKRPTQAADEHVIEHGGARFAVKPGSIEVTVGGQGFTLTGEGLQMTTKFTAKGGSRPAHYKGGLDTNGDKAVDGNDQMLV